MLGNCLPQQPVACSMHAPQFFIAPTAKAVIVMVLRSHMHNKCCFIAPLPQRSLSWYQDCACTTNAASLPINHISSPWGRLVEPTDHQSKPVKSEICQAHRIFRHVAQLCMQHRCAATPHALGHQETTSSRFCDVVQKRGSSSVKCRAHLLPCSTS